MQSWLAKKLLQLMKELSAGNIRPTLRLDARDVELTFPGDSSWSGVFRGKEQLKAWLERFVRVGLQIAADEVVVKGFPWSTTVCVRGTDHLDDARRRARLREPLRDLGPHAWGRLKRYEVYEDTQKPKALDSAWLDAPAQPSQPR